MITPLDIQNKEFKKVIRGYKESEVEEFLDKVIIEDGTRTRDPRRDRPVF